jgi:hypothetical protein
LEEGRALLVEIGFRTRTKDFTQEWFIPEDWSSSSFGMQKIEWSRELINNKMLEYEENAERVRLNKEREKNVESSRKVSTHLESERKGADAAFLTLQARALEEARGDRERVAVRAERERVARKAIELRALQAEKEASEAREAATETEAGEP